MGEQRIRDLIQKAELHVPAPSEHANEPRTSAGGSRAIVAAEDRSADPHREIMGNQDEQASHVGEQTSGGDGGGESHVGGSAHRSKDNAHRGHRNEGDGLPHDGIPITPIGKDSEGAYHFIQKDGQLRKLKARDFTAHEISGLFDGDVEWLRKTFPKYKEGSVVGWVPDKARDFLIHEAAAAGSFDPPRQIRDVGVWRGPETAGRRTLIVHCGDAVLVDKTWREPGFLLGGYVYPRSIPVTRPANEAATLAQAQDLLNFVESWVWAAPLTAPRILLGWIACAMIPGLLSWRPHLLVTGRSGSGKSTLDGLLKKLLGSTALCLSAPTEAGIRQQLGSGARAVLIDELETDRQGRARDVYDLSRLASTADQAPVGRGSAGGVATQWPVNAIICITSILHVTLRPQDQSRFYKLELLPLPTGSDESGEPIGRAHRERLRDFSDLGPRFMRRVLDAAADGRLQANIDLYEMVLAEAGHSPRSIDRMAPLLGAAEIFYSDKVATASDAETVVRLFAVEDVTGADGEGDPEQCLNHLCSSRIVVEYEEKQGTVKVTRRQTLTVGEVIVAALNGNRWAHANLRRHGLLVVTRDGKVSRSIRDAAALAVSNSENDQGLTQIYRGSRWANGVWSQSLRRVSGATPSGHPLTFAGTKSRAACLPLDALPIDPPPAPKTVSPKPSTDTDENN